MNAPDFKHSLLSSLDPPRPALWILKTGHTLAHLAPVHGDFEHWIAAGLQSSGTGLPIRILDITQAHQPGFSWPAYAHIAGLILTGSHAMVSDRAPWSEASALWLQDAVTLGIPTLGICFGHQLLAHALGGFVAAHPKGLELGSVPVHAHSAAKSDPLWCDLPAVLHANTVHYQSVLQLPEGAVALAYNDHEPHHAFRYGPHAWGVQFHPEFDATAMHAYVSHVKPASPNAQVLPTAHAARLLPRFATYAAQWVSTR